MILKFPFRIAAGFTGGIVPILSCLIWLPSAQAQGLPDGQTAPCPPVQSCDDFNILPDAPSFDRGPGTSTQSINTKPTTCGLLAPKSVNGQNIGRLASSCGFKNPGAQTFGGRLLPATATSAIDIKVAEVFTISTKTYQWAQYQGKLGAVAQSYEQQQDADGFTSDVAAGPAPPETAVPANPVSNPAVTAILAGYGLQPRP